VSGSGLDAELDAELDARPGMRDARWPWIATVGPYVALAGLAVATAVIRRSQPGSLLIDLGLCALTAAWMLWFVTLHPRWRSRTPPMLAFFAGFAALMQILVLRDPWFGVLTPFGYVVAFRALPWPWLLPGVAAMAAVSGTAQASGVDTATLPGVLAFAAVLAVNMLPMCGYAWFAWTRSVQQSRREQAMDELSAANRRLEATLAENESLHERLLARAREAGVLDERQRMAREIHDTLAQGLTGIITQLQAAEHAGAEPAERRRHVEAAIRLARESLTEARRSVHALRPEPLETARLSEALADVAARWSALHEIDVRVTTTGTARTLRPETEAGLLRTAQEALANVAKHARASRVGVTLSYLDDEVALDVRDDGQGFDPAVAARGADHEAGGGFGLIAMRQRIEGLAGRLQIESEPGAGTAVSACVPAAPVESSQSGESTEARA
jgi:signal transduction histidine kinase